MVAVQLKSVRGRVRTTDQASRDPRRWDVHLIFWGSTVLMAAAAMIRNSFVFTKAQYPYADEALNSLLVNRAEHFDQLVGNYSRVRFHHPGPALLYILSWGQGLFHDALHIVPAPYNGQLLAAIIYGSAFIALTLVCLYRLTGSRGATAVALGIAFVFAARFGMLAQGTLWFPFLYMPAFLLFTVAGAAVAVGRTRELPLYVLGAGVIAHGHVSFLLFVAVTTVFVAGGWSWRHRSEWRAELRAHRRGLVGSGALFFLFALPLAIETLFHYPGQWPDYFHYVEHAQRAPRTFDQILNFMGQYWTTRGMPIGVSVAAAAAAVVLTATERDKQRRLVFLGLYAFVVLQSALTLYYVARGVDELTPTNVYVGFFYMTVPLVLVMAAATQLWVRITDNAARVVPHAGVMAVAVVAVLAMSVLATRQKELAVRQEPKLGFPSIVSALRASPDRGGRAVEYVLDEHDTWPPAAGVAAESARVGLPWCVRDGFSGLWSVLFDSSSICPSNGRSRWVVHFSIYTPLPRGARVLAYTYSGHTLVTLYDLPGQAANP